MKQRNLVLCGVSALVAAALACSSANPATPVAPSSGGPTAAADGSTLKASAPSLQSPNNGVKLTSTTVVLAAAPSTLDFASGIPLQYRFQVMNAAGTVVDQALVSSTSWTVTAPLTPNATHTWRVRPEYQNQAGPWSATRAFITVDPAIINDPLTNGTTVGHRLGGQFVPGGWQTLSTSDSIFYDIPTCDDCVMEFDITNIGKGEGVCCTADLKFMSMGDGNTFGDFGSFRDHQWKMHLIQRGDGDGTGLEIIWRNGGTDPEDNPGDHRIKMTGGGPDFRDSSVFHFVVKWTPRGYAISVGTNGGPQEMYLEDGFGSHPYSPPNHRIALGCPPRADGFPRAIYRNVLVKKNQ